jgi:uncharacterized membrane protein
MKRFVIFGLLFPPIAFVLAFWIMLQIANIASGEHITAEYHQVMLLPLAYVLAIVPALLTAWVDHVVAHRPYRILWTALAGYVLVYLPLIAPMMAKFLHGPEMAVFGITGAIPAAICSWLAGYKCKESVAA